MPEKTKKGFSKLLPYTYLNKRNIWSVAVNIQERRITVKCIRI